MKNFFLSILFDLDFLFINIVSVFVIECVFFPSFNLWFWKYALNINVYYFIQTYCSKHFTNINWLVFRCACLTVVFINFSHPTEHVSILIFESLSTFLSNRNTELWNPSFANKSLDLFTYKTFGKNKLIRLSNCYDYGCGKWWVGSNVGGLKIGTHKTRYYSTRPYFIYVKMDWVRNVFGKILVYSYFYE